MLEVCDKYKGGPEDVFFSSQKSFNYPSRDVAKNLFVEGIIGKQPIGVHKSNLNYSQMKKLCNDCPEYDKIFKPIIKMIAIIIGSIVIGLIILLLFFKWWFF